MSSALKPVLTSGGPQNSQVPLNKPMHPQQGPPATYGQPSHHLPPGLGLPSAAHSQPPIMHPPNHFAQHYPQASNHPLTSGGAIQGNNANFAASNKGYSGGYPSNYGHPPNANQNSIPPVSQALPPSGSNNQPATAPPQASVEPKPHSNGTQEPPKVPNENHVSVPKEAPIIPTVPSQVPVVPQEAKPLVLENKQPVPDNKSTVPEIKPAPQENKPEPAKEPKIPQESPMVPTGSSPSKPVENKVASKAEVPVVPVEPAVVPHSATPEGTGTEASSGTKSSEPTKSVEKERIDSDESPEKSIATPEKKEEENIPTADEITPSKQKESPAKPTLPKSTPPTTTRGTPGRKSKTPKSDAEPSPKTSKIETKASVAQKSPVAGKSKRSRTRTQPYQSPLPELEIITKITAATSSTPRSKGNDDKLIVFYKNEFLAVRNSEGSFYICQAVQNINKSSGKIKIRWLSLDKNSTEIYTPDFYDQTDFDCILTNLNLTRIDKAKFRLPPAEKERTDNILKRSLAAEKGEEVESPTLSGEHPDGLDLSLIKEESQIQKRRGAKRKAGAPLKAESTRSSSRKLPDKPKVAKTTPKTAAAKKKAPKKLIVTKKPEPVVTPKKGAAGISTRGDKSKRKSDSSVTKVSPKVDPKKAKVLAKMARKGAISVTKTTATTKKETKPPKAAASSSKAKVPPRPTSSRTKRAAKK